ncbi:MULTISPECIES: ribonuclease III [Gemella]|uniref:ribonuclease III n=1 Tax=Gemella TaxID=1378 RepID=UPI000767F19E|nr:MULTISPECIES: ribonuclease III [Gemella]AME09280.1 ribonuclease III [Gemella sp. oral taxon 928]AXI26914.1 ribonuclease III [Gemella sp. ND 6198]
MQEKRIKQLLLNLNSEFNFNLRYGKNFKMAFSHSSYTNEHRFAKHISYERLEFLGDAVVEVVTSEFLFKKFPTLSEGELTKLRASIVCEKTLVKYALSLGLDKCIFLGKGEEKMGGRTRPALLADIFESFTGALYLETNLSSVRVFLENTLYTEVKDYEYHSFVDYKTILQEFISREKMGTIEYKVIDSSGPSHLKTFTSSVTIEGENFGIGSAKTKKESEQQAAKQALKKLGEVR